MFAKTSTSPFSVAQQLKRGLITLGLITGFAALSVLLAYVYINANQKSNLLAQADMLENNDKFSELSGVIKDLSRGLSDIHTESDFAKFIEWSRDHVARLDLDSGVLYESSHRVGDRYGTKVQALLVDSKSSLHLAIAAVQDVLRKRIVYQQAFDNVFNLKDQVKIFSENQLLENHLAFYEIVDNQQKSTIALSKNLYENAQKLTEYRQLIGELFQYFIGVDKVENIEEINVLRNKIDASVRNVVVVASEVHANKEISQYARDLYQQIRRKDNVIDSKIQLLRSKQAKLAAIAKLVALSEAVNVVTRDYREFVMTANAEDARKLQSRTTVSFVGMMLALIISFVVYLYFFKLLIYKRLILPMLDVTRRTLQLSRGDLSVELPRYTATELNNMTDALNIFREKSKALETANIKLLKANKEIENFAYVASHDLKSPLRGIDRLAYFLRQDLGEKLDSAIEKIIDEISRRVTRLDKLLDDLLRYARNEEFAEAPESVSTDLFFRDIFTILDSEQTFKLRVRSDIPCLNVVATPLKQIVHNLMDNAIKHHDQPAGNLLVGVTESDTRYFIYIEDDGPGIPSKYHKKIFDMFQTLKPKDVVEGSGIGLALVAKLVERFNGSIEVSEAVDRNRGTRFSFDWPKALEGKNAASSI